MKAIWSSWSKNETTSACMKYSAYIYILLVWCMYLPGPASKALICLPASMSHSRMWLSRLLDAATVIWVKAHKHCQHCTYTTYILTWHWIIQGYFKRKEKDQASLQFFIDNNHERGKTFQKIYITPTTGYLFLVHWCLQRLRQAGALLMCVAAQASHQTCKSRFKKHTPLGLFYYTSTRIHDASINKGDQQ